MAKGVTRIVESKSRTFLAFCFSFILGSSLGSFPNLSRILIWPMFFALCVFVSALIIFWSKPTWRFVFLACSMFLLGILRLVITIPDCTKNEYLCGHNGKQITFLGAVASEPSEKIGTTEYLVRAVEQKGLVQVRMSSFPKLKYGEKVEVSCTLETPVASDTFRYDKYLSRLGVWSSCRNPRVRAVAEGSVNPLARGVVLARAFVLDGLKRRFHEPESSLMAGLLYGARSGLPKDLTEDLSRTGVSHIVAVSGFNITIIIVLVMNMLIYAGMYRQKAFFAVIVFTVMFVVFSGLSSSAVRAALMGITLLTARQIGRGGSQLNSIVFAATLMQLANPYLLLWDVGFQLSFLATIGLSSLSPKLSELFPDRWVWLRETMVTTLSAIIMTLPLILYQFGTLSLVAPLVNMLVLWTIPYLMLLGFLSLVFGFIAPLSSALSYLAHLGLSYVIMVIHFFSKIPLSSISFRIPLWSMIILYCGIIYFLNKNSINIWVKEKLR